MASIISNNYYKPTNKNTYTDTSGAYYKPKPIPNPKPIPKPPVSRSGQTQSPTTTPTTAKADNIFTRLMDRINASLEVQVNSLPQQVRGGNYAAGFDHPLGDWSFARWLSGSHTNPDYNPNYNPRTPIGNTLASSYGYDYKADNPADWQPNPLYSGWTKVKYLDNLGVPRWKVVNQQYPEQTTMSNFTTGARGAYVNPFTMAGQNPPAYTAYSGGGYSQPIIGRTGSFAGTPSSPWLSNFGQTTSPTTVPTTNRYQDSTDRFAAWFNRTISTPQEYFNRMSLNGIGYSVPNQMLSFTDTGGVNAWDTTTRWFEPPAGYTDPNHMWKESVEAPWGKSEEIYDDSFEPIGGGGGGWGSGWGGGGGGGYGASSPRYTGGYTGRGSSYAGGQYQNQAAWRMPMLVWNI